MLKHTEIGVDLGEDEIKLVTVSLGEINQLEEFESYPVESKLYSNEYFGELKRALKDFSKKINKRRLSLNITFPLNEYSRALSITVPAVEEKDLKEGIAFEARQALTEVNLDDYELAWKITETHEDPINEHEVSLSLLNKKVMKKLSQFKTINYRVNRVMLQADGLEYVAKDNDIIIDFGERFTRVYMYEEGLLSRVEYVESGGSLIDEAIEKYKENGLNDESVDIKENLYLKSEFTESTEGPAEDVSNLIHDDVMLILDEVKRTVRSFELQENISVDKIYYAGGLTNLKHLPQALESSLDLNVVPLNVVAKEIDGVEFDIAGMSALLSTFDCEMDFSRNLKVNLDFSSVLIAALAISLSMTIALKVINDNYEDELLTQEEMLSEQNHVLSESSSNISLVEDTIVESEDFITKIDTIKGEDKWLSDILYALPDKVPLSIAISSIDIKDGLVELEGYSADYSSVGFLVKALEEIGEVEIVDIADYKDNKTMYSVVTDNPESISDRYIINRTFKLSLKHNNNLMDN